MPKSPLLLAETLRYLYENVRSDRQAHETILHYCIARFNAHQLEMDQDFMRLLLEVQDCQQDLIRLNMERGFKDES